MSVHSTDLFSILVFITHSPFSRLLWVQKAWIRRRLDRLRHIGRDKSRPWDEHTFVVYNAGSPHNLFAGSRQ